MSKPVSSKYYNRKTVTADGIRHDSKKEANRWMELKLLEKIGKIEGLRRQVKFEVIPPVGHDRGSYYIADFVYIKNGETVVEDCKGYRTEVYRLKRKLMRWRYGIRIKET